MQRVMVITVLNRVNALNAELNPICHLLALLGAHLIFHVSRIRVNIIFTAPDRDEHSICNTDCKKRKISAVYWAVMSRFAFEV